MTREPRNLANVRRMVTLRDEGLTMAKIGMRLGCSPGNVCRQLQRWGDWVRIRRISGVVVARPPHPGSLTRACPSPVKGEG